MHGPATLAVRQLAALFAAAGLAALAALAVPGSDPATCVLIGLAGLLCASLTIVLPRTPWRGVPELLLLLPAWALVGAGAATRLLPARSYSSLFILLFAWVGAHRRPRTGLWLAPPMAVAYAVPLLLRPQPVPFSAAGCVVTIAVGMLVAEGFSRTVAARTVAESAGADTAQTLRVVLDRSPQPTIAIDAAGRCVLANDAAATLTGFTAEELVGQDVHDAVHHTRGDGTPYPVEDCPIQHAVRSGEPVHVDSDEWFVRKDGDAFAVEYRAEPILRNGSVVGAVVIFSDITARRRAEQDVRARLHASERRANTDVLTGVGNRRHAQSFLAALRPGDAIVLIDVDHFKSINDTRGHAAGDQVLVDLATHLAGALRGDDELARFGGEEFLLVLTGAGDLAEQVVARIASEWTATTGNPTFSAGIAVHRDGDPERTIALADTSLYRAKAGGRNRIVVADDASAVWSAN